jgi:hypothetical protein
MTTPWSVPKEWVGETAVVLGGGPSMSKEVADYVQGKARVIAVNSQGIEVQQKDQVLPALAPWADILYAGDAKWWNDPFNKPRALAFQGRKVTMRNVVPYPEVLSLEQSTRREPFDARPNFIVQGSHSGYQAIHLAAQFGVQRIILCGFDLRSVNNRAHWFGSYYSKKLDTRTNYRMWMIQLGGLLRELTKLRVEVINCTPGSMLRGARLAKLNEVLH